MADLIEIKRVRQVIERIKDDADRRRHDAVQCPPLGAIYTGMAFAADEIIARLESLLTTYTLRTVGDAATADAAAPQREEG